MGHRTQMDYDRIETEIRKAGTELLSPYNDGWTAWMYKEQFYKIKWLIESYLEHSPTFSNEEEFIKEHQKKVMWKTLQK